MSPDFRGHVHGREDMVFKHPYHPKWCIDSMLFPMNLNTIFKEIKKKKTLKFIWEFLWQFQYAVNTPSSRSNRVLGVLWKDVIFFQNIFYSLTLLHIYTLHLGCNHPPSLHSYPRYPLCAPSPFSCFTKLDLGGIFFPWSSFGALSVDASLWKVTQSSIKSLHSGFCLDHLFWHQYWQ